MDTSTEQWEPRWHDELAHLKAQIETLKTQIESGFEELHRQLDTEIAAIEEDVSRLEVQTASAAPADSHVSKIEAQIEQLRAQGDAAYDLLQATLQQRLDPIDVYIKRLEAAAAASTSEEVQRQLRIRIEQMQGQRTSEPTKQQSTNKSSSPEV